MNEQNTNFCPLCSDVGVVHYLNKNNHDLYQCSDCDLVYVWPIPSNLEDVYHEGYFNCGEEQEQFGYVDYDKDKEPMREIFNIYLDKFTDLAKHKSVFDVGSATGFFLDIAQSRGWKTAGIDISHYAVSQGRDRGHSVYLGELTLVDIFEKYGVVTMWDVLEHVRDPKKYLMKVREIISEDGLLLVNTIDAKSLWAKFWGKRWNMIIPPEHLFYFSKNNLVKLLEDCGFEILEVEKRGKKFSLSYIFNILYNWHGFRLWKKLSKLFDTPFWRKLYIPLNVRDNILVLAKKNV